MGIYSHFLSLPVPTGSGERLASPKAMPGALSHVLEKPLHLAEKKKKIQKLASQLTWFTVEMWLRSAC